VVARKFVKKI